MSVEELYDQLVSVLTPGDQVQLASLILFKCAGNRRLDYSDAWSEEDIHDFTAAGLRLANRRFGEDEESWHEALEPPPQAATSSRPRQETPPRRRHPGLGT